MKNKNYHTIRTVVTLNLKEMPISDGPKKSDLCFMRKQFSGSWKKHILGHKAS
jgi:hypothetical protein